MPEIGQAPLQVQWSGVVRGGRPPYSFVWDFGAGGAGSSAQNPAMTYTTNGLFVAELRVTDADATELRVRRTVVVGSASGLPVIESVVKKGRRRLKLKIRGSGFQSGCVVHIDGLDAPRTRFKSAGLVIAKKGQPLEDMLPLGRSVLITVVNPGGPPSLPVLFVR